MASLDSKLNGLRVSRETRDKLELFVEHFQKWSLAMNLVAPSTIPHLWERHIRDSIQIFELFPEPKKWIDMGSGAGFPGLVTAILLTESQHGWVHLIESNNKKAAFLRTALDHTGARGTVHPMRVDAVVKLVPECDAISARALAELDVLLEYSEPWFISNPAVKCFFHKGRDYLAEIDKARGRWTFDLIKHQSVVEQDSVIIEISNLQRAI